MSTSEQSGVTGFGTGKSEYVNETALVLGYIDGSLQSLIIGVETMSKGSIRTQLNLMRATILKHKDKLYSQNVKEEK